MQNNFSTCLAATLKWEGGYSNHPVDPGGATNFGITQERYNGYLSDQGISPRSVKKITKAQVNDIYRRYYWDAVKGDELPYGVDLAVFDYAVNSGPSRSIKHLQEVLGVDVDGVIGPVTLKAVFNTDPTTLVKVLCDRRLAFVKRLGKLWRTFGKGWSRRIAGIRKLGIEMVTKTPSPRAPTPTQPTLLEELFRWVLSLLGK